MNFSFLSPFFLIGLAAVVLPVIAHLISRKSGMRKRFPAVRFLTASRGDSTARSRLRDLLLLLLRALVVILIVLVFAKPSTFSFAPVGQEVPRTVAVVLDNSFSMGYDGNFARAKERALDIIDALPDGSFGLAAPLVGDDRPDLEPTNDMGELKNSTRDISLSASYTDNQERLEEVYGALDKVSVGEKEVAFITDLQKNGWENGDYQKDWLKLVDVSDKDVSPNRAVSRLGSELIGNEYKLSVRASNFSETAANDLLAEVRLGSEEAKGFFDIAPGESEVREFAIPTKERIMTGGSLTGSAGIKHDNLKIDDTRYLAVSGGEKFSVLIVDGDPREDARLSETYYLAGAAETVSELSGARVSIRDNDSFIKEDLTGYDLIFLANVGDITPRNSTDLEEFIKRGGILVIFPGERIRSSSYNTLLGNLLPGEMLTVREGEYRLSPGGTGMFPADVRNKLNGVQIRRFFDIVPPEDSETFLTLDEGKPFLVAKNLGRGSVFLFTTAADASWSDLPITPVFLPIVKTFMDTSDYSNAKKRNFIVGDIISLDIPPGASEVEVTNPGGRKFNVNSEDSVFEDTDLPGIYTVIGKGRELYKFAVNVDPRESNLEKISIESTSTENASSAGLVKVFREIWRYFLLGALALFLSESAARAALS